jgi:protein-disulfide isomerase
MHDMLMAHQGELDLEDLHRYAVEIGIDAERLVDEIQRRVYADRVAEDISSADASGVAGTPTFFINGRRHQGLYDVAALAGAIDQARRLAEVELRDGLVVAGKEGG